MSLTSKIEKTQESILNNQFSNLLSISTVVYRQKTIDEGEFIFADKIVSNIFIEKAMARGYDLEDRLINYTCRMINVVESLPKTRSGNYMAGQLIKSCHSPAFNYSESQAAESPDDFIHKLKVVLKELKECRTSLKIIIKKAYITPCQNSTPYIRKLKS